ncbi:DUF1049 domain-containing protein [Rhodobacterales bacterium HKCCSP123]|nr:DUF1049 domain-containing protein [Rhodobacterales bacterium HKCCSP123]
MVILRYLKYLFLIVVALVLVLMAFANREVVLLEVIPENLAPWIGVQYAIELPLFAVVLGSVMVGILVGFVWEWLREHRHRAEAKTQKRTARALEREVQTLKGPARDGQDEILALVDGTASSR